MAKKKILFVIESLSCGGAEKSLVSLLQCFNYDRYEVDLQLFTKTNEFDRYVPSNVRFLQPLESCSWSKWKIPFVAAVRKMFALRMRLGFKNNNKRNMVMWKYKGWYYPENHNQYDIAIAYSQGTPTFYVAEKVKAHIKIAYKNSITDMCGRALHFYSEYYAIYSYIVCVSDSVKKMYANLFPEHEHKMRVIYDINNANFIRTMAKEPVEDFFGSELKIITIGSLKKIKGYDFLIDAAVNLKERNINYTWFIIGEGQLRGEIEEAIRQNGLADYVILLGRKMNPYPYIWNCDICVSTSRAEGFGLTLAEAKILDKPVVTTCFATAYEQIENGINGLIVDMNGRAIAEGILQVAQDEKLRNRMIENLKHEKKGNTEEVQKLYELIES